MKFQTISGLSVKSVSVLKHFFVARKVYPEETSGRRLGVESRGVDTNRHGTCRSHTGARASRWALARVLRRRRLDPGSACMRCVGRDELPMIGDSGDVDLRILLRNPRIDIANTKG